MVVLFFDFIMVSIFVMYYYHFHVGHPTEVFDLSYCFGVKLLLLYLLITFVVIIIDHCIGYSHIY